MNITLHDTPKAYKDEFQSVRATLIVKGTSLTRWLAEKNIDRQLACRALKGTSFSRKAVHLRARILKEVFEQRD